MKRRKTVDVSIIIVNWNRLDDVLKNLHYLRRQKELRKEVVVVDNGSTDGSAERLSGLEWIRLIRLPTNVGPAEARNYGIRIASGRYIVFLDSDTVLPKSGLAKLVSRMEKDPTIGIIGCRIVNSHTRKTDGWIHALPESSHELREFDTYSFSAAGAIVRARALRAAGPFWDELFIYNEEVDLSIRMVRAGYRILYSPEVRVYHHVSQNGRVAPGAYWRLLIRNWIWIFYRYYPARERLKKVVIYSIVYLIKGALNRRLSDCFKGIVEGLRRTEIIGQFPEKLTPDEVNRLYALNRRSRLRLGR
jgi:N-acetylglucosaminyl-diphospho-decaprenol L-rhamnosyltransferase